MTDSGADLLIAMGGNLPSDTGMPVQTLAAAVARFGDLGISIRAVSRFFRTPCFPPGAGPDYVNAALRARSDLSPQAVLDALHHIESRFGRARTQRWRMRTLDLDLLSYDDLIAPTAKVFGAWRSLPPEEQLSAVPEQLVLPHPRIQDRAFVLVPLFDIAAGWVHPVLESSVAEMYAGLGKADRAAITPL